MPVFHLLCHKFIFLFVHLNDQGISDHNGYIHRKGQLVILHEFLA